MKRAQPDDEAAEEPPSKRTKEPILEFDPDGDLILTVGANPERDMKVDSHTLCRMSPVFHRMLRGNFAEAKPDQDEWRVRLPEDSIEGLTVIMDMIHCQYDHAIQKPTLNQLCQILVLTNKYDIARVLRPVARRWIEPYSSESYQRPSTTDKLQLLLFVAWELGHESLFTRAAKELTEICEANSQGFLLDEFGQPLFQKQPQLLAHNVDEILKRYRLEKLNTISAQCRSLTDRLMHQRTGCDHSSDRELCNNISLGNMITATAKAGVQEFFLPLKRDETTSTESVISLIEDLDDVAAYMKDLQKHLRCCPLLETIVTIEKKLGSVSIPGQSHLDFLREQAKKTKVIAVE